MRELPTDVAEEVYVRYEAEYGASYWSLMLQKERMELGTCTSAREARMILNGMRCGSPKSSLARRMVALGFSTEPTRGACLPNTTKNLNVHTLVLPGGYAFHKISQNFTKFQFNSQLFTTFHNFSPILTRLKGV